MDDTVSQAKRRATRSVAVGDVTIGGDAPIVVQGMTNVPTHDIDAVLAQIDTLVGHGCELVRLAVPRPVDTAALGEIVKQAAVPIVADVHFHYARAIEAVEAGVHKIRLNPGNISDRREVLEVIAACKAHGTAIRVGVNEGSILERRDEQALASQKERGLVNVMLEKLAEYVAIFADSGFENLVLSAKTHGAAGCIAVNRAISSRFDYPLHLGVTHAGDMQTGSVRSAVALGTLLSEGIGDTVRVSLTADPAAEIDVAWEILNTLKLRPRTRPELICCPTCGRTQIDLIGMVERIKPSLAEINRPVTVAVMGCVVNGPGEAADADVALCGGRDKAMIYSRGKKVAVVSADRAVDELLRQIRLFLAEN